MLPLFSLFLLLSRCVLNVCRSGEELICAGYTLYSSANILVLTVGALRAVGRLAGRLLACPLPPSLLSCAAWLTLSAPPPTHHYPPRAGQGVYGFTFDPLIGEYILSHPDIKIPNKGKIYSFNEGNYAVRRLPALRCTDLLRAPMCTDGVLPPGAARPQRSALTRLPPVPACTARLAALDARAARVHRQPEAAGELGRQALLVALHRLPRRRLPPHPVVR